MVWAMTFVNKTFPTLAVILRTPLIYHIWSLFSFLFVTYQLYHNIENFTIYGYTGSKAETYANENVFTFISLGQSQLTTTTQPTTTEPTTTQTPKGNTNGDGKVSVADARKIVVAIAKNDFNF